MKNSQSSHFFGLIYLFIWLNSATILLPLPHQLAADFAANYQKNVEEIGKLSKQLERRGNTTKLEIPAKDEVIQGIWIRWSIKLIFVLLGLWAGLAALRQKVTWRRWATLMSMFFLGYWILPLVTVDGSIFSRYLGYAKVMLNSEDIWDPVIFLQRDVVLPIAHLVVLIVLLSSHYRNKPAVHE